MQPSISENHSVQQPALDFLQNMGYTYLSPKQAFKMRGQKHGQVVLEDVLREQLAKINRVRVSSTKEEEFTPQNIDQGIRALQDLPLVEGYLATSQKFYELLTLGKSLDQQVGNDRKSFDLQYIDWKNPENNVFHVTEEMKVLRSGRKDYYKPDIVLFINGIPLLVIEAKSPDLKNPMSQGISQHLRNQGEDGIRPLYVMTQIQLVINGNTGRFGTNGTPEKFWSRWKEDLPTKEAAKRYEKRLQQIKNKTNSGANTLQASPQDNYLYGLCRPERLLDLIYNFILYDNGEKKVARYQQYFAVKKSMTQIAGDKKPDEKREGGVVWHTQGSGKSLTMVMLAQAIGQEKSIKDPIIILVTDRTDLDAQITGTFQKCGMEVTNAKTGVQLVDLLQTGGDAVVTTIINKFETAVRKMKEPLENNNIFVLVDEGHRSQYGTFNIGMQKTLPNACFIAFTGTPLFKSDKNTLRKFGSLIDTYTVDQAVKDKAVVPLLFEGRHALQEPQNNSLDNYFNKVSEPLNDYERADLKKKFSQADQLNQASQKIMAICWDISEHYKKNFQNTQFKGQVVCQGKPAALQYKKTLDEIGIVSTELVISGPDMREGDNSAYEETTDAVKSFWKAMMDQHGNAKKYEQNIVNRFKNGPEPELLIVVDKLLTGFDAPRNTVLYLTRNLTGHRLLQAIARVNRVAPDKDYGYVIDYYGVAEELYGALQTYSTYDDFETEDLEGTITDIVEELKKLPQAYSDLWKLFDAVDNKNDEEAYQQVLRDKALRVKFYRRLATFAKLLKLGLSSIEFHNTTEEKQRQTYKDDLAFFLKLKKAVSQRYSDKVDYKKYEGQIQKLIDTHIPSPEVYKITNLVDIFDRQAFKEEVESVTGKAAKADVIASRTAKHTSEKMEEDPAFYKKFSELIEQTIDDYLNKRINEKDYLEEMTRIMNQVLSKTQSNIPETLKNREVARAFYGICLDDLKPNFEDGEMRKIAAENIALEADKIIEDLRQIDWQKSVDIPKKMIMQIGDYIIDHIRDKYQLDLSYSEIDKLAGRIVDIAKIRY